MGSCSQEGLQTDVKGSDQANQGVFTEGSETQQKRP